MLRFAPILIALIAAGTASAQVVATVGPDNAPVGAPIQVSLSNHSNGTVSTGACFFTVQDTATGNFVFNPLFCILIIIPIAPNQVHTTTWDQRDMNGNQVPPGAYDVNVTDPMGNVTTHTIFISAAIDAGTEVLGSPRIGSVRNVALAAPAEGNDIYLMGASLTANTGIPTCNGTFPLDNDFLLMFSTMPGNGVYLNTIGTLDPAGNSQSPAIVFPNDPMLVGLSFQIAFLTIEPLSPCPVSAISSVETVTMVN